MDGVDRNDESLSQNLIGSISITRKETQCPRRRKRRTGWKMNHQTKIDETIESQGLAASFSSPLLSDRPARILIIDDNVAIHNDFRKILLASTDPRPELESLERSLFGESSHSVKSDRRLYEIESAYQGEEGYRMIKDAIDQQRPFSTAFVDMRMPPGWDGVETIQKLWSVDPDLQVLICTAFSDYSWSQIADRLGNSDQLLILRKPFDAAEVCQIAAAMTEKRRLTEASRMTVASLEQSVDQKTSELRHQMHERELAQQQLLDKERQLRESQKLEAVGMLAGGIAHEFNNLLQIILSYAQFSLAAAESDKIRHDLQNIIKAGDRAKSLTRQLLGFSRRKPLSRSNVDVNEVVNETVDLAQPLLGSRIKIRKQLDCESAVVHADSDELQQALLNFCINSRDAMDSTGELTLSTNCVDLDEAYCGKDAVLKPGPFVCISISDTGCGMTPEVVNRIFEPFFTTKEVGTGTGLGMAMVYGLVKQHQGHIEVDSQVGQGTTFRIFLPAVTSQANSETTSMQTPLHCKPRLHADQSATILVADDEELLRQVSRRILQDAGYQVITASDGQQAVDQVHRLGEAIDLAILDVMMPNMTGRQACEVIRQLDPCLPLLFCTGHDPTASNGEVPEGYPVVHKPYSADQLVSSVRELLGNRDDLASQPQTV